MSMLSNVRFHNKLLPIVWTVIRVSEGPLTLLKVAPFMASKGLP